MGNYQVLVLCTSSLHHEFAGYKSFNGFNLAGIVDNGQDALMLMEKFAIDVVIVEIANPVIHAFEFIDTINIMEKKPLVIALSSLQDNEYYVHARRLGAKLVYKTPYFIDKVMNEALVMLKSQRKEQVVVKVNSDKALDERLANIFISSGIPPHIKGYQFLREAVKQSVQTPAMINNITKQLYPAVAEKFDTSASKVERAIRHAIEVAWSRGKIDNINTIYGIKVFSKGEKPTNGELIALVSDKMIIECS